MKTDSWLPKASERSAHDPKALGSAFSIYLRLEKKTPEALMEKLGCSPETYQWLSLCGRPTPDRFLEHVQMIADRYHVDVDKLAEVIRHAEVLEAFSAPKVEDDDEDASPTLLAAQDRKDEEEV